VSSGDEGMMPILGSGATKPCELTATLVLPLLQLAAAVMEAAAVAVVQLAVTSQPLLLTSYLLQPVVLNKSVGNFSRYKN